MIACPKCNCQNDDNAKFCHQCGQPLTIKSFKWLKALGLTMLALITIIGGMFVYYECNPIVFYAGKEKVVFEADGGEITIPINTRGIADYDCNYYYEWLTITQTDNSLKIKCTKNTSNNRNANITLHGRVSFFRGLLGYTTPEPIDIKVEQNDAHIYGEVLNLSQTHYVERISAYGDYREGVVFKVKYTIRNGINKNVTCKIRFYDSHNDLVCRGDCYQYNEYGYLSTWNSSYIYKDGNNTTELFIPYSEFPYLKKETYYCLVILEYDDREFTSHTFNNNIEKFTISQN